MEIASKIKALYEIYKNRKSIGPNTHLALVRMERMERAFHFYGPEVKWWGREKELIQLYDQFVFAMTYTNEFGHTGFTFRNGYTPQMA